MKRVLSLVMCIAMLVLSLSGCESTLAPIIQGETAEVPELSMEEFFTEAEGFHFPNTSWGISFAEFQANHNYPISELLTYGDDENKVYAADGLKVQVMGRTNDEASAAFNGDDICREVSVAFGMKTENPAISQEDLWVQYPELLKEKFGEPESSEESGDLGDDDVKKIVTYSWAYETPDGKQTELHCSAMYLSYAAEPSTIAIGFLWKNAGNEETK